jgi:pimeloyl-ACP methyl ester carboxylesterase
VSLAPSCSTTFAAASRGAWTAGSTTTAFTRPWGFELESVRAHTLVVQGQQDLMVPWAHGESLASNLPSAEAWLREDEGHLTLLLSAVPHIHEWLLARFASPGVPVRGSSA